MSSANRSKNFQLRFLLERAKEELFDGSCKAVFLTVCGKLISDAPSLQPITGSINFSNLHVSPPRLAGVTTSDGKQIPGLNDEIRYRSLYLEAQEELRKTKAALVNQLNRTVDC